MAGARKGSRLGSRTARVALKARHQPYWINIAEGVALGYRRGPQGGSWYARVYAGEGQYQQAQIGGADDHLDANAETILTFYQAQEKARKLAQSHDRERGIGLSLDLTVAEAADKYLVWYKQHRRAHTETEHSVRAHILPALGSTRVDELSSAAIRSWLEQLV